jgi:hypothetical protein
MSYLANLSQQQFLNEPVWKWAIFGVAVMSFLVAWSGVIRLMKE